MSEMIEFSVSEKRLAGDPWTLKGSDGKEELMQGIYVGDFYQFSRPVSQLSHIPGENGQPGKVCFTMAAYRKDGSENSLTIKKNMKDAEGYHAETKKVTVKELKEMYEEDARRYRAQFSRQGEKEKTEYEHLIVTQSQISKPFMDHENQECVYIKLYGGFSLSRRTATLHPDKEKDDVFHVYMPKNDSKISLSKSDRDENGKWNTTYEDVTLSELAYLNEKYQRVQEEKGEQKQEEQKTAVKKPKAKSR